MMKRLVAAAAVLATIVACAGCSSSAPTPNPAPASNEQRLGSADLDGDGKEDLIFGVPRPEFTTFTSIHVLAGSGETLLSLTNADGDLAGALTADVKAPTPVLVVGRVGPGRDDLLTAYLYDKATGKLAPVPWAGKQQQPLVGKAEVNGVGGLDVNVLDTVRVPRPYKYKDGALAEWESQ